MGNAFGIIRRRTAKVMKINGETIKFKTPVYASEVLKDYPGLVLLESEAVKHFGTRAKPLEPQQELVPKRLYFLVELPKFPEEEKAPRRVRSAGIHMNAKERLESLMLARRSVSDLSLMKPMSIVLDESKESPENGAMRLKMRIPKAEMEKLMRESKDEAEAAAKIMDFCMKNQAKNGAAIGGGASNPANHDSLQQHHVSWKADHGNIKRGPKSREKRVGFMPIAEGEIQLAVA